MLERRLVGRRFIDFHPDAAHPFYPNELERRVSRRRSGDREGACSGPNALLMSRRRRRPPILWSGILRCQNCGRELVRARNLSREARRYFIVEHAFASTRPRCECENTPAQIEWILQSGTEAEKPKDEG